MALMTYTAKDRNGTYYFRRIIPAELRPFMPAPWRGKREWKRSLKTKLAAEAKVAAAMALSLCTTDFEAARSAQRGEPLARPSPLAAGVSLADIEAHFLGELLEADEAERKDGDARRQLQTSKERAQWPDLVHIDFNRRGMEDDHHIVYGELLEEDQRLYRAALSKQDPRIVDGELRSYLKRHHIPINPTSEFYYEAGLAVLRAHVRANDLMLARQRGDAVETPSPASTRGPKLSEAFERWKAGGSARGARKPSDRTLLDAEYAVRRFTEYHGDLRLGDITREKARSLRDALSKTPTRLPAELRKLPLKDLLKRDLSAYPPVHAATVNKSLQMLGAIVSHAVREGEMDRQPDFANPFDKAIKLVVDKRSEERRKGFEAADLKAIFGTPVYASGDRPAGGGGEAAFWLPLIALLTGARQAEIAELRIADVKQDSETDIWFLDISTEGGRSIKTASSRRRVPLHDALIRAGLLRYRESLVDAGAGPEADLWPGIMADAEGRRAGPWSKWFNRYLRDAAKVTDSAKVFHSFRHTFKRLARNADLSEEVHDALTGHTGGGVGRSYGAGFGLEALKKAIDRIAVPDAVRKLAWEAPPEGVLTEAPKPKRRVKKLKLTPRHAAPDRDRGASRSGKESPSRS